jgi:hypothetical protein
MQTYFPVKGNDQGQNGEKCRSQHIIAENEGNRKAFQDVICEIIENSQDQQRVNPFFPGFQIE